MDGIPPARDTDAEDVVWALQTSEALWKRNERGDAIVWLRRAAQSAGETNDDDRALELARTAAELTEWLARASSASLATAPPPSGRGPAADVEIDTLLRVSQVDPSELAGAPVSLEPEAMVSERTPPVAPTAPTPPPAPAPAVAPVPAPSPAPAPVQPRPSERVLSAAESHAGMLDPWSEPPPGKPPPALKPPVPRKSKEIPAVSIVEKPKVPPSANFEEEVVTSAGPLASLGAGSSERAEPAKPPAPRAPKAPPAPPAKPQPEPATKAPAEGEGAPPPSIGAVDLSAVEAFADLPDDAKEGLAKASRAKKYAKGDAIDRFGLLFVIRGDVHVMASGSPAQATTLGKGAVLRARGTLKSPIALDAVCASESCVAATWDEEAVEAALGACPWVEDDLRASADRVQALAGATMGTLGQKLSHELRASIVSRLTMRPLVDHEAIVTEGIPVPGILLVGAGKIELVINQVVTSEVTAGQFILPAEALSAGPSPASARAAVGGALVLVADRKISQELFATEPLLLELFAGW
jgi:hypothetical protein